MDDPYGSKEGDIYSFAIICSELITKAPAWDLGNRAQKAEGRSNLALNDYGRIDLPAEEGRS